MRVFVTGATGFIGEAIVRELREAGHEVTGLARSDAAAETLARWGAGAHRGELADLESLAAGARASEGVIHAAFIHDFSDYAGNGETDRRAVEAMGAALAGTDRPLVVTSGTTVVVPGRPVTEEDAGDPSSPGAPRVASEEAVLAMAQRGVRGSVVRLPPSVHGAGDHAFIPALIEVARRTGVSAHVGDGANRWPAVHRLDAARLFRLALEKAEPGTRLHGVGEEGVALRDIARTIGEGLGVPVRSIRADEAQAHFGWLGGFASLDVPASSAITRRAVGWDPRGPDLLTDMRENGYFA
ncbi:SDR family oxidoreductase [Longimicrobium terrae]|uniref:Nucleoside-diphosphate-sugar epimerase n=1 Tax=Longimicrobium terrae TaxID=1639882 RepID=A0A841GPM6_9BACT|nr:SDR family oxidoreductase [Longimicrobium terrae]MBB4634190.1 nucleoside-diphosphate-sugar epimerase [Longimicrobium terrae]MBB6068920.1 nucleoside-diphosphate-sugar epimerase [Longimicrobium terrae]NNC28100.1 SDR family oxidoreductase [Longimicrobium terrae]